ncbi:MAG TPA: thiamine phosphate synthase [Actinomycetota bacterium]
MDRRSPSLGVYVVTSSGFVPGRGHREVALAAIEGHADAVQLRAPELTDDELLPLATELAATCRRSGVLFVVNDLVRVAVESGADGVHLGQGDELQGARERLGPDRVLGISVAAPEEALTAEAAGADYLGVTVWATATKPEARPQGIEGLRLVVAATSLPIVGIGGIDASNAAEVLEAGAVGVAVISAVGAARDPAAATKELADVVRLQRRKVGER